VLRVGRPSLAGPRTDEILTAASRCIARHGLEGATLQRIASESGYSRGHVRHYLGNRDDLLDRVLETAIEPYVSRLRELATNGRDKGAINDVLDYLFGPEWGPGEDSSLINALFASAPRHPRLRERILSAYLEMQQAIAAALVRGVPAASRSQCRSVAYSVLCLAFGHSSLAELSVRVNRTPTARAAAASLVQQLSIEVGPVT
jgi:AcrR family transcriptional regulator